MSAQGGPALGWRIYMWYVYILKNCKTGDLYKGYTKDLRSRLLQHKQGLTKTTKINGEWKLIYYEGFISEKDARVEELFLKSGKGRDRLKYLLKHTISLEGGQDGNVIDLVAKRKCEAYQIGIPLCGTPERYYL